jgi:hypothetical protein
MTWRMARSWSPNTWSRSTCSIRSLAEQLGCSAIRTMVLGQSSLAASGLYAAGHRPEGATLWKPVEDMPARHKAHA